MTVSTVGEEIKYNPRLRVKSREEYIELMNMLNLPSPKMMDVAVPANKNCGLDCVDVGWVHGPTARSD